MGFWEDIEDHIRRLLTGRTREDALRQAAKEAVERYERHAATCDHKECSPDHAGLRITRFGGYPSKRCPPSMLPRVDGNPAPGASRQDT